MTGGFELEVNLLEDGQWSNKEWVVCGSNKPTEEQKS